MLIGPHHSVWPISKESNMAEQIKTEKKQEKASGFVILKRDPETYGPPYEVAVPPSEVDNYKAGGYEPA